jgi:hypothetical protein
MMPLIARNPNAVFFSAFRGSVQRLPSGNTLIAEAEWGRIFEVKPNGRIVWEYINPYFKPNGDYSNRIYRAIWVSTDWLSRNVPSVVLIKPEQTISLNTPNPFNGGTRINFTTRTPGPYEIKIYDVRGRLVRQMVITSNSSQNQDQSIFWDGKDAAGRSVVSGSYLYTLGLAGKIIAKNQLQILK